MITKYEFFSSSVATLSRDIQTIERTEMAKFGLKGPHAQCLLAMSRYPEGITSARLCEVCDKDRFTVVCGDGFGITFTEVQADGGKRMKTADYLRGNKL